MKYCRKCGTQVPDHARFCPNCGADLEAAPAGPEENVPNGRTQEGGSRQKPPVKKKSAGKIKKILIPAGIAAAVLIIALAVMRSLPATIDLNDYFTVNSSGYDGRGSATVEFDETKFADDIVAAMGKKQVVNSNIAKIIGNGTYTMSQLSRYTDIYRKVTAARAAVTWKFEDADGNDQTYLSDLSNGDTVTLHIAYDNESVRSYKIQFKASDIEESIKNLKKVKKFDAFKNVSLTLDGADGYGTADIKAPDSDENGIIYEMDDTSGLSNGDTVTVTVLPYGYDDFNESYVDKYGKIPEKTTKKYKVSGLEKVKSFDAFANVTVYTDGIAPNGTARLDAPDADRYGLVYELDKDEGLSNGDTVTVTVSPRDYSDFDEDYISEYGTVPESTSDSVTISALAEYLQKLSDISDTDMEKLKKEGNDQLSSKIVNDRFNLQSITYSGAYLLTDKGDAQRRNIMVLIYQLNIGNSDGKTRTIYAYTNIGDVLKLSDGSVDYNANDVSVGNGLGNWYDINQEGYGSLDEAVAQAVTSRVADYNAESTFTNTAQAAA